MDEYLRESQRRYDELRQLLGSIIHNAVQIENSLGGLIQLTGKEPKPSDTFGRRIKAFNETDLASLLSAEVKDAVYAATSTIHPYRDRLAHDEWTPIMAMGDIPEGTVQGQGEKNLTTTSFDSLRILDEVYGFTEDTLLTLYNRELRKQRDIQSSEHIDDERFIDALNEVIQRLDANREPKWVWREIKSEK